MVKSILKTTLGLLLTAVVLEVGVQVTERLTNVVPDNITQLNGPVDDESYLSVKTGIDKAGLSSSLLEIQSPGGIIDDENLIKFSLDTHNVDTLVTSFAASAAAQIFIHGQHRYVTPYAIIIFHGAAMGEGITEPIARQILDSAIKQRDIFLATTDLSVVTNFQLKLQMDTFIYNGEVVVSMLHNDNMASIDDVFNAIGGSLSKEVICHELFGDFVHQQSVLGSKLIAMGIAEDASHIDMNKYKG